ncbi:MAG: ABC transporter ATP-binding protein, partial [Ilumatobacteraceae bacterium]
AGTGAQPMSGAEFPEGSGRPPLLDVSDLVVKLPVEGQLRTVLDGINLTIHHGESVGLVGESGSGKSMTAKAIDRLLPAGAQVSGSVQFNGLEVLSLNGEPLRSFRRDVAMIFQDPRAHINPVRRIGDFMTEAAIAHNLMSRSMARERALELLDAVGIDDGARRLRQYPHELSGGMLQRVMIASALLTDPRLILADEPTTALDVTTQAEVMAILDDLRRKYEVALLFITHDLELASAVCDRTAVMYAGQIVEIRSSELLHDDPLHPYSAALAAARPRIDATSVRLKAIPGRPLSSFEAPTDECSFAPRCAFAIDDCRSHRPALAPLAGGLVRCSRADELRSKLAVADA